MLLSQPLASRFGGTLEGQLKLNTWDKLDIAAAWVRRSGTKYLDAAFAHFLRLGGELSIVVGIDLQSTTEEGLSSLLDLSTHGNIEVFVHHNESGSTFHPKLYLFRNASEARLIVASNNITEGGLYSNTEAALQIDRKLSDTAILQSLSALGAWKDTSSGLARRLTPAFLADLVAGGYVPTEASFRAKAAAIGRAPAGGALFSSRSFAPPMTTENDRRLPSSPGSVLLMRLRKAHLKDRPTQTQIPIRLLKTNFFSGTIRSAQTSEVHSISQALARGSLNTLKLEIPEMRDFQDPMIRFERHDAGIIYDVYDAATPSGSQIMASLLAGMASGETMMTTNNTASATWWRFI